MLENATNSSKPGMENLTKETALKKIFVTGGTGLVGSRLIEQLVKKGKGVKALYRTSIPEILGKEKVEWIRGDVLDVTCIEEAFTDVSQVYHCAAIVSFTPEMKQQMFATNVEGTTNIVNTCLNTGVQKLCFVSSVAALGKAKKGMEIDEKIMWSEDTNNSNYGKSKYMAEIEVWRGAGEGLKAVIVNPSIILGKGNWNEGSSKIFKTAYEEFPWFTEGITGFVDVNDVVEIMMLLMDIDTSGERFIVSTENRTYRDIFTKIAKAFGKRPPYKKVSSLMADAVWRLEVLKSIFTKESPLLTKETAGAAREVVRFNNSKILHHLPTFTFTPIDATIDRVCKELKEFYHLKY